MNIDTKTKQTKQFVCGSLWEVISAIAGNECRLVEPEEVRSSRWNYTVPDIKKRGDCGGFMLIDVECMLIDVELCVFMLIDVDLCGVMF